MHTTRVPAAEADTLVIWHRVVDVRCVIEGQRRFIVVVYDNGAEKHLQPHQARDLWYSVEQHRRCPAPCFYRRQCDTAPKDCADCKLAENLEGLEIDVRPQATRPRFVRPPTLVLLCLFQAVVIGILMWACLQFMRQSRALDDSPPSRGRYPAKNAYSRPPKINRAERGGEKQQQ